MATAVFTTSLGQPIRLGKQLGQGGEGTVFSVEGNSSLAAKIYKPTLAASRFGKIKAMVAGGWHKSVVEVAFPIDTLFDSGGAFAGFTMRLVGGRKPVHEAYSPQSQKQHFPNASFPFLIRIALNTASAVAKVHSTGCVIGDINHSGFLVSPEATVTLIDADSFQLHANGQLYNCRVGVPEFTPPELQGQRLDSLMRTPSHDNFGLAVLVFYILFMGRHPFAGRPTDGGDVPESGDAIKAYRFAYSSRMSETKLQPPHFVPRLTDVPAELASMFELAFNVKGATSGRPKAADWVTALTSAEAELVPCSVNGRHQHFRTAASCPWCRMEKGFKGFRAFGSKPQKVTPGATLINVGQYISALQAIPDPGPPPDLESMMPKAGASSPSKDVGEAVSEKQAREVIAIVGAAIGVGVFFSTGTPVAAIVFVGGAFILASSEPAAIRNVRSRRRLSHSEWQKHADAWPKLAGSERHGVEKSNAEKLIERLRTLPSEEQRQLKALSAKQEASQRQAFLRQQLIADHSISGLGDKRKARLRQHGIVSAADVGNHTRRKIRNIKGCAELFDPLVDWRNQVERGFKFNPASGVSPADVVAIQNGIATRRLDLERQVGGAIQAVRVASFETIQLRTKPSSEATNAWQAREQAQIDARELDAALPRVRKTTVGVGAAIAALALIGTLANSNRPSSAPPEASVPTTTLTRQDQPPAPAPPPQLPRPTPPPTRPESPIEPVSWAKRDIGGGRMELSITDPSHASVQSLRFACALNGRLEVRALLKQNVVAQTVVVQVGKEAPTIATVGQPVVEHIATALVDRIIALQSGSSRPLDEAHIAATPVQHGARNNFRLSANPELAALRSDCTGQVALPPPSSPQPLPTLAPPGPAITGSAPALPPPIQILPAPGDLTTRPVGPPMDITPQGQRRANSADPSLPVRPVTPPPPPRQTPWRTTSPSSSSATGGLY